MQISIVSAFLLFFLSIITCITWSDACQPTPSREQMEFLRERLRTALIVLPPVELRNLTSEQIQTLNQTIDRLVRLQTLSDKTPIDLDPELLRAAQLYANQLRYNNGN
ncbi:hypothetical protein M3Y94_00262900 [Aphelenchoides besseyi]|nr:hypothetical protein M3Y94_00262900 [Aphelenchoides besseyi]